MFVQEAVIELEEWASCMALIKGRIWTGLNNGSVCLYNAKVAVSLLQHPCFFLLCQTLQLESTLREAHSRTVTVVHYCKVENVGKQNEDKSTVWTGSLDETCFVWKCKQHWPCVFPAVLGGSTSSRQCSFEDIIIFIAANNYTSICACYHVNSIATWNKQLQ